MQPGSPSPVFRNTTLTVGGGRGSITIWDGKRAEGPALTSLRPRPNVALCAPRCAVVPMQPAAQRSAHSRRCLSQARLGFPSSVETRARDAVVPVVLLAASFWRVARVLAPLFSTHLSSLSHAGHSLQPSPCLHFFSVGLLVPATVEKTR